MNEEKKGPANSSSASLDIPLLDGASAGTRAQPLSISDHCRIAKDGNADMEERLEAYEDIIDSEVGDTSLVRARNVEREVGLRQLYLKFEGGNPTGTQKDRIAFGQAMDALRRGFDGMTLATCGNYGVAAALAASLAGLRCVAHIPAGYQTKRHHELAALGACIVSVSGDYENAVEESRRHAEAEGLYDANPGGANTSLQLRIYAEIAYEIYDELRDAPRAIAVPVSNGTTLAGIYKGFLSLYRRGKTSRMPWMVAGSSFGKNPIVQSFLKGMPSCEDLKPEQIRETDINQPLINWHSADGDHALQAVRDSEGWASHSSDKSMSAFSKLIREREGLHVLPASTAGLISLVDQHRKDPLGNDRYVAILTGRKE